MMKRKLKKVIFVLVIFALALPFNLVIPQKARAEERPSGCRTTADLAWGTSNPYRCATFSPGGYTLHLWHGDQDKSGGDEIFNFVGSANWGVMGAGDIGQYVYRSTSRSNYYVAVEKATSDAFGLVTLRLTHSYNTASNKRWDEFAAKNRIYKVFGGGDLPNYKNAIDSSGNRFVWRVVVNGTVTLNNEPVSGSFVKLKFDSADGPAADQVTTNNEGKFEFSLKGVNEDIWVNQGTVSQLVLYAGLEKDGKKYEATYPLSVWGSFRNHESHNDAKVDNLGVDNSNRNKPVINFTASKEVEEFSAQPGGEQSITEETSGGGAGDECEKTCPGGVGGILHPIKKAMCEAQCFFIGWLQEILQWLIDHVIAPVTGLGNVQAPTKEMPESP